MQPIGIGKNLLSATPNTTKNKTQNELLYIESITSILTYQKTLII